MPAARRAQIFQMRVTPAERVAFKAQARAEGLATSAWIRSLAVARCNGLTALSKDEKSALNSATTELNKAGVNLNALLHEARLAAIDGKALPWQMREQYEKVLVELREAVAGVRATVGTISKRRRNG
ncbi:MAG: plasmid mobilization protein [Aliihoeflea sp.]|uniref:plasmid mobilization protein n=1 Tax=Aliihoeflea sp. TaxID=2608088 RepID=UPI0040348DD0